MVAASHEFTYGLARASDFNIHAEFDAKKQRQRVKAIEIDGHVTKPSNRFWRSFFHRFGIADTVFKYFDYDEVLCRINERAKSDRLRYCIERNSKGEEMLLAVSNPSRPIISYEKVVDLTSRYATSETSYHEGIVTTTHTPRSGDNTFDIRGDEFKHRYVMETPIDGFSAPKIHLSLLRLLCENGAIGYSRAFRSEINVGNDIGLTLSRALDSYDNDEGYSALRQRFSSAQSSWASLRECEQLRKLLIKLHHSGGVSAQGRLLPQFDQMTGNLHEFYGLANLDALGQKRQRVLPSRARVYDLINFASEIATHHAQPIAQRPLQAYIGSVISDEYDMEGTADRVSEFQDFFMAS
jgi:hypothetical protein